jgi:hypothetical protein
MAETGSRTTEVTSLPAFREAQAWLASAEARAAAKKLLHQYGLAANPDDVTQDALFSLWQHLTKHPEHSIDSVPAYCRTIMRNVVTKAAQGFEAVSFDEAPDIEDQQMPEIESTLGDDLRAALEAGSCAKPWVTAAALNYVTLAAHPSIDTHRSPLPLAGATPEQARVWPSLWFAGERSPGLFPTPGKHSAAQRKRLSRAAAAVTAAIEWAKTELVKVDRRG